MLRNGRERKAAAKRETAAQSGLKTGGLDTVYDHGASINAADDDQRTVLYMAADKGRTRLVQDLIAAGTKLEKTDEAQRTPLYVAARGGHTAAVKALLAAGANIESADMQQRTPLHMAVRQKHCGTVEALLEAGANTEAVDEDKFTPLHVAILRANMKAFDALLAAGASTETPDRDLRTPLHVAAERGNAAMVKALLAEGANAAAVDRRNCTPLDLAVRGKHIAAADALRSDGGAEQLPQLHMAAERGKAARVRGRLAAGDNCDATDTEQRTALHMAAQGGHAAVIEVLAAAKAEVEATDSGHRTPLHVAAAAGHAAAAAALIKAAANLEAPDAQQRTPVHTAAAAGHVAVVQILLAAGAKVEPRDRHQLTPLHLAAQRPCIAAASALLEAGAGIDAVDGEGRTVLHLAAAAGYTDAVKALLEAGACREAADRKRMTPLHAAAREGRLAAVKALAEAGCCTLARCSDGKLPSELAQEGWHWGTVKTLRGLEERERGRTQAEVAGEEEGTEVFFNGATGQEADAWIAQLLEGQQCYAAVAFRKDWLEQLAREHPELHKSIESRLVSCGFINILDCEDVRWYRNVAAEATAAGSAEGFSLSGGMQWLGGVVSKRAASLAQGAAEVSGKLLVAFSAASVTASEDECTPRQCCLARGVPENITANPPPGEATNASTQQVTFRGRLDDRHEFNLHVILSCCATSDEVHVKLMDLEGQLKVPAREGHKFGVTNVKVQLHARQHRSGSPLQLLLVNLDEPLYLDKHEVPFDRYYQWHTHALNVVGPKMTSVAGVPVPMPELTWECKPEKLQVGEKNKWVAVVKLQSAQESVNGRLPGSSTVELVRSMDNTWLTDASNSGARGVRWSATSEPLKFAAKACTARSLDVTVSVHVSAAACYIRADSWNSAMSPIVACKYRRDPICFQSNEAEVRLLTAA